MKIKEWFKANFDIKKGKDEQNFYINCPYCIKTEGRADTKFHMGVSTAQLGNIPPCVHCFRCGHSGSVRKFIAEHEGVRLKDLGKIIEEVEREDIAELLMRPDGMSRSSRFKATQNRFNTSDVYREFLRCRGINGGSDWIPRRAFLYLKQRHLDEDAIRRHGIRFCTKGRYAGRILIPVFYKNEIVGFIARTLGNKKPKYLFPENFEKSKFLFNFDNAVLMESCILVEGVFDVFRVQEHLLKLGIEIGVVCMFGKVLSDHQLRLVIDNWKYVYIMLDRDASSYAYSLKNKLTGFVDCKLCYTDEYEDPAEIPADKLLEILDKPAGLEVFLK